MNRHVEAPLSAWRSLGKRGLSAHSTGLWSCSLDNRASYIGDNAATSIKKGLCRRWSIRLSYRYYLCVRTEKRADISGVRRLSTPSPLHEGSCNAFLAGPLASFRETESGIGWCSTAEESLELCTVDRVLWSRASRPIGFQ